MGLNDLEGEGVGVVAFEVVGEVCFEGVDSLEGVGVPDLEPPQLGVDLPLVGSLALNWFLGSEVREEGPKGEGAEGILGGEVWGGPPGEGRYII